MSINNEGTRRFAILDRAANANLIFDKLVKVRDVETGEEGLLLCSHQCKWPSHLISQATWLEGCLTPKQYQRDERLAMGYHPNSYTQWRIFKDTNEVEIYLTGDWSQEEEDVLVSGLPYISRDNSPEGSGQVKIASLLRLARKTLGTSITQEGLDALESTVHRLVNDGRVSALEASLLGYHLSVVYEDEVIHFNEAEDVFCSDIVGLSGIEYPSSSLEHDAPTRISFWTEDDRYSSRMVEGAYRLQMVTSSPEGSAYHKAVDLPNWREICEERILLSCR